VEKKEKLIEYWLKTSDFDYEAAQILFQGAKFPHALFYLHLSVEKMLKAFYIKARADHPPKTHNLVLIIREAGLELSEEKLEIMLEINGFNQEARYPDEKMAFYKKCTREFAADYLEKGREIRSWLRLKL